MPNARSPAPPSPPEAQRQSHSDVARSLGYMKPTREEIAQRAYEIYQARKGKPGNPDEDWLQAERELTEARRSK
jgi:hypothetical protein